MAFIKAARICKLKTNKRQCIPKRKNENFLEILFIIIIIIKLLIGQFALQTIATNLLKISDCINLSDEMSIFSIEKSKCVIN